MSDKPDFREQFKRSLTKIAELKAQVTKLEAARSQPIAIVGMACRLPGANGPEQFWGLLENGKDFVREIPAERAIEGWPEGVPRWAGLLDQVDEFDPMFFGISPREALSLDPQQRLALEVTWEAIERARIVPATLQGSATGVFLGLCAIDYYNRVLRLDPDDRDMYCLTGNIASTAAGRLSYTLGLHGPAVTLDTACSSSLVAIHLACDSLRRNETSLALAGGVHVIASEETSAGLARTNALSPDGRCRTFDQAANGFVRGEGCGMLVLERLDDAQRHGRNILAVIRGSAINQDGKSTGMTAPNVLAQQALLRDALQAAGITAEAVSYIECHGTGTPLGDPIEVEAIKTVFAPQGGRESVLWLGAVKTNIGHLEAGAGVAGVIKAALAMQHRQLPPNLHTRHLNPRLSLAGTQITPLTANTAWQPEAGPRIAGVSAFGLSGTNAHVILEEPPAGASPADPSGLELDVALPLLLSGRSEQAVRDQAARLIETIDANPALSLTDLGYSLATTRTHFSHRVAVLAKSLADARERLVPLRDPIVLARTNTKIGFLFTGQGAQRIGMGRELYENDAGFRTHLDEIFSGFDGLTARPLAEVIFAAPGSSDALLLDQTVYTQPALFAVEVALFRLFTALGARPEVLLGHSIGELVAAHVAGVFSLAHACKLVAARARLMQALPAGGAMVSIQASEAEVRAQLEHYPGLDIAGINGPTATVVSGDEPPALALVAHFEQLGRKAKRLVVSHAFHSHRMEPMLDDFRRVAESLDYHPPTIRVISNVTGEFATSEQLTSPDYWVRHVRHAVRFLDGIRTLEHHGVNVLLEIGPHGVLSAMVADCLTKEGHIQIPSLRRGLPEHEAIARATAALHQQGARIDWRRYFSAAGREPRLVDLPTYPFQRQRFWLTPGSTARRSQAGRYALSGHRTGVPTGAIHTFELGPKVQQYLVDHVIYGVVVVPGAFYVATFLAIAESLWPKGQAISVSDVDFLRSVTFDAEGTTKTALIQLTDGDSGHRAEFWTLDDGGWHRNASAVLALVPGERLARAAPQLPEQLDDIVASLDDSLRAVQVEWGESWWRIRHATTSMDQALGRFELDPSERKEAPLSVREIDNAFGLMKLVHATTADAVPLLPFSIGRVLWYGRSEAPHLVSNRSRDPLASADQLVTDLAVWDAQGQLLAEIESFTARRAPVDRFLPSAGVRDLHAVVYAEVEVVEPALRGQRLVLARDASGWPLGERDPDVLVLGDFLATLATSKPPDRATLIVFDADPDADAAAARQLTLAVFHALRAWLGDARLDDVALTVVTYRALAVDVDDPVNLHQSALVGLLRSARAERPDRVVRQIDLDDWGRLDRALTIGGDEPELVLRGPRVLVPRVQSISGTSEGPAPELDPIGTVLITGGTGALGSSVALHLAERHGIRHFLLLSRSGERSEAGRRLLTQLESLGASARIVACDVANRSELESALSSLDDVHPLVAVFHTAGQLADATLASLDDRDFDRVFAAKVDGALNLRDWVIGRPVQAFVLFSSVASVLGSAGQANYAAANSFLDALASDLRRKGQPAHSLAWGAWEEGGMAAKLSAVDKAKLRERGLTPLTTQQGLELLDAAMLRSEALIVPVRFEQAKLDPERFAILRALVRTPIGRPGRASEQGLLGKLAGSSAAQRERIALDLVLREAAAVLGLQSVSTLDPKRALQELGLDSLMAVELRNRLKVATQLPLPATLLFDYPTPIALARMLVDALGEQPQPVPSIHDVKSTSALLDEEAVAIVGMACRLPGHTNSPEQLWALLESGGDAITSFPDDRGWSGQALLDPDPGAFGRTVTLEGGFISDPDQFDPSLFGISPREAVLLDPQQRLLLELAWEALERARIAPDSLEGSMTGVWLGLGYFEYAKLVPGAADAVDGYAALGNAASVAAGRIAYTLGLRGPTLTLDTACSSGLVVTHLARKSLLEHESDLAIVGAATIFATPDPFIIFSRLRTLAPDGRCKSFSAAADGAGWAEGAGVVVLERLSDAIAKGHPVLAIVRGSAINQDGRSQGLTAPNGPAQQRVIRAALGSAKLDPADVDVVEAHGTGTKLGDPIEAQALIGTYGQAHTAERPLFLGSVKSNIGHTQSAAGIAGLIKMVLALQHQQLPRTLYVDEPAHDIDWSGGHVTLLQQARAWPAGSDRRRRAGISAFGVSGTNAHVILEEAPQVEKGERSGVGSRSTSHPFVLSGQSEAALIDQVEALRAHLDDAADVPLVDVAFSLATTRTHFEHRACVVAAERGELLEALELLARRVGDPSFVLGRSNLAGKLVFVFPGQGSQWVGMAKLLLDQSPAFRASAEDCARALAPHVDWSLLAVLRGDPDAESLERVDVVQPALFAMMIALAAMWRELGVVPDAVVGHSQGEIAAACVAGALSLEDAAKIVALRSRLIAAQLGEGAMAVVSLPADEVERWIAQYGDRLALAVDNGPTSTAVSGEPAAIEQLLRALSSEGIFARRIQVNYASHCAQVDGISAALLDALAAVRPRQAEIPMVSTVDVAWLAGTELDATYWLRNLRQTVRFAAATELLLDTGHRFFVEISAHPVMAVAINGILHAKRMSGVVVGTLLRGVGGLDRALLSLGELHCSGHAVDWGHALGRFDPRPVALPTYAFQRSRYWAEPQPGRARALASRVPADGQPLLGSAFRMSTPSNTVYWAVPLSARGPAWLMNPPSGESRVFSTAGFAEISLAVARFVVGPHEFVVEQLDVRHSLRLRDDASVESVESVTLQVATSEDADSWNLRISEPIADGWRLLASARIVPTSASRAIERDTSSLAELRARLPEQHPAEALDPRLTGPGLRHVESLAQAGDLTLARLSLAGPASESDQLDAALLQGCLQLFSSLAPGPSTAWVPVLVERIRLTRPLGAGPLWCAAVAVGATGGRSIFDLTLWAEDGELLGRLEGVHAEPLEIGADDELYASALHEVTWREIPPPAVAMAGHWIVLGDHQGVAPRLVASLESYGADVRLVDGVDPLNPADVDAMVDELLSGPNQLAGIVCLWSLDVPESELQAAAQLGWTGALYLTQSLQARPSPPRRLVLVTHRSQAPRGPEPTRPEQALLWGLGGAIRAEHAALHPLRLDLGDVDSSTELENLARVILAETSEDQVALRAERCYVARLERASLPASARYRLRAARGHAYRVEADESGSLQFAALDRREPGPGEVEIAVAAAGVNARDLVRLELENPTKDAGSAGLGLECAGVITRIGPGTTDLKVGQEVVAIAPGCWATHVIASADRTLAIPAGISALEAATLPVAHVSAYYGLHYAARLQAGERVLILPGTDAVGLAARQWASSVGAEVFANGSAMPPCSEDVMRWTEGEGADVVLSSLPGKAMLEALALVRAGGRFVDLAVHDADANDAIARGGFSRGVTQSRVDVGDMLRYMPRQLDRVFAEVLGHVRAGHSHALPHQISSLSQANDLRSLEKRDAPSIKQLLVVDESVPLLLAVPPRSEAGRFCADASYLITGGLGGLGLSLARSMAERGAGHLILLGRSGVGHASQREAIEVIETLARVTVVSADVADRSRVKAIVADIPVDMPLRGVVHAAAVLDDATLVRQTPESFARVLGPKVVGGWNLHLETKELELDFFVMYSSAATLIGSPGQANYVAANAFLDSLAAHRRHLGLPALSISWGLFSEVGLAASESIRGARLATHGVTPLSPQRGNELFSRLVSTSLTHVAASPFDVHRWVARHPDLVDWPYFETLLAEPNRDADASLEPADGANFDEVLRDLDVVERRTLLRERLVASVAAVIQRAASSIECDRPLTSLGFDSLMVLEFVARLRRSQIEVSAADVLRGFSVDELVDGYLVSQGMLEASARAPSTSGASATSSWIVLDHPKPGAHLRLVCFPYGGGGPAVYTQWSDAVGPDVEVLVAHLPGRGARIDEPPPSSVAEAAREIAKALIGFAEKPLIMFGHCLGAIIMSEVAEILEHEHGIRPAHLIAAAAASPTHYQAPQMHLLAEEHFVAMLGITGFANVRALEDRNVRALLMPMIVGDFKMAAEYGAVQRELRRLSAPITAIAGKRDLFVPPGFVPLWETRTAGELSLYLVDDHHYFIETRQKQIVELIQTIAAGEGRASLQRLTTDEWNLEIERAGQGKDAQESSAIHPIPRRPNSPNSRGTVVLIPDALASAFPLASIDGIDAAWDVVELGYSEPSGFDEFIERSRELAHPLVIVGSGFGAICGAEIARALPQHVARLVVINAVPPAYFGTPLYQLGSDDELIEFMRLHDHPNPSRSVVGQLRAGIRLMARYAPEGEFVLRCPITVLRADLDLMLGFHVAARWSSVGETTIVDYSGHHFTRVDSQLGSIIAEQIRALHK
jgi:polyketide synthase 12